MDERWLNLRPLSPIATPAEIARFARFLRREGTHLLWTGYRNPKGYGSIRFRGEMLAAHRLAFALANDGFPVWPYQVAHRCDRPACCAPGCLLLSTQAENNEDQWRIRESPLSTKGVVPSTLDS